MEKSLSSVSMDSLSLSQMMTLQKYALLKLTALMEKYSPSHKTSGWHWGVQKLFKRMKSADQKLVRGTFQKNGRAFVKFYITFLIFFFVLFQINKFSAFR